MKNVNIFSENTRFENDISVQDYEVMLIQDSYEYKSGHLWAILDKFPKDFNCSEFFYNLITSLFGSLLFYLVLSPKAAGEEKRTPIKIPTTDNLELDYSKKYKECNS